MREPPDPARIGPIVADLARQRNFQAAERVAREALAASPDNPVLMGLLASVLVDLRRLPEAERLAQGALGIAPDCTTALRPLAFAALVRGRLEEAETLARRIVALEPGVAPSYALLADVLASRGRTWEALEANEHGLGLAPAEPVLQAQRAQLLRAQGRIAEADGAARTALATAPGDAAAHRATGQVLLDERRPAEAEAAFREALRLDPTNVVARQGLHLARARQGYVHPRAPRLLRWVPVEAMVTMIFGGWALGCAAIAVLGLHEPRAIPLVMALAAAVTWSVALSAAELVTLRAEPSALHREPAERATAWASLACLTAAALLALPGLGGIVDTSGLLIALAALPVPLRVAGQLAGHPLVAAPLVAALALAAVALLPALQTVPLAVPADMRLIVATVIVAVVAGTRRRLVVRAGRA